MRRLAMILLPCLAAGLLPSVGGEALHAEGIPCPDANPDQGPCDPGCLCACCPGHLGVARASAPPDLAAPPPRGHLAPPPDADRSDGVPQRIFHPPRA